MYENKQRELRKLTQRIPFRTFLGKGCEKKPNRTV